LATNAQSQAFSDIIAVPETSHFLAVAGEHSIDEVRYEAVVRVRARTAASDESGRSNHALMPLTAVVGWPRLLRMQTGSVSQPLGCHAEKAFSSSEGEWHLQAGTAFLWILRLTTSGVETSE